MAELKVQVQVVKDTALRDIQNIEQRLSALEKDPVQIKFQVAGIDSAAQQTERLAVAQSRVATAASSASASSASFASSQRAASASANDAAKRIASLESSYNRLGVTVANFAKYKAFEAITSGIRNSITDMRKLDDELVTVRKVADATQSELDQISKRSYEVGGKYGKAPSDYAAGVAEFSRAGYRETAEALAELSIKSQLVGDMSATVANQFLLATDAAYGYKGSVSELSAVLDGMNAIDNNFATSIEKISAGLGKVAPIASQANVGVDELTAALGTITAVTQRSGEEAATALRALFLNIMGDTKTEIEDGATWTAGEIDGLRDILERYAPAAVAAAEATGKVINPMEAMRGLAQSMKDGVLTQQELMQMVTDIGGKLRSSQLLAIVQNWDTYERMLSTYQNAAGSADAEVSKMMDSWSVKAQQLKTSFTKMLSGLADSREAKGALDFFRSIVEIMDSDFGRATLSGAALAAGVAGITTSVNTLKAAFQSLNAVKPMGWVTVAIAALGILVGIVDELVVTQDDLAERAAVSLQAYEDEKNKLSQLETELSNVNKRIEELNGKPKLSLIENSELESLKTARTELQTMIALQKELAAAKLWESAKSASEALSKNPIYSKSEVDSIAGLYQNNPSIFDLESNKNDVNYLISAYNALGEAKSKAVTSDFLSFYSEQQKEARTLLLELATEYQTFRTTYADVYESLMAQPSGSWTPDENGFVYQYRNAEAAIQTIRKLANETEYYQGIQDEILLAAEQMDGGKTVENIQKASEAMLEGSYAGEAYAEDVRTVAGELAASANAQGVVTQEVSKSVVQSDAASAAYVSYSSALTDATERCNLLTTAFRENEEEGSISRETLDALNAQGIELGEVLETDAGRYKVVGDTLSTALEDAKERLSDLVGEKVELDTEGIETFDDVLKDAISDLDELKKLLSEMGESGDAFREYQDVYADALGLAGEGRTGTNAFSAYIQTLFNDDVLAEIGKSAEKAVEYLNDSLISGMLDKEKSGEELAAFMLENFEGSGAVFTDLGDSIQTVITDWDEFSKSTGLSVSVLQSLFGYIQEYDGTLKDFGETGKASAKSFQEIEESVAEFSNGIKKIKLSNYIKEAKEAGKTTEEIEQAVKDLNKRAEKGEIELTVDVESAEDGIEELDEESEKLTSEDKEVAFSSNAPEVQTEVEALHSEASATAGTYILRFDIIRNGQIPAINAAGTDDAEEGPSFVNEIGPELIVSRGRAYIADGGRPTITDLHDGDIVYNHLETQAILSGQGIPEEGIQSFAFGTKRPVAVNDGGSVGGILSAVVSKPSSSSNSSGSGGSGGGSGRGSSEEEDDTDWWSVVQDWFDYRAEQQQRAIDRLDYQIELLENDLEDLISPLEKQIDQIERLNDQLDRRIELLERQQEELVEPIQDEIDALEKAKEIQDEQLELAERQKAVEEARNELQNAQNERTIRYFNEQKGQWEWMADKGAVQSAQDSLESAEKSLSDFEYEMHIRELERQISQIEDLYNTEIDELEDQQLENEDKIYDLEQKILAAEDAYNAYIEPLEKQMTELERKLKEYEEKWAEIELPFEKPEDSLSEAISELDASSSEKEEIKNLIDSLKSTAKENLSSVALPSAKTVSVSPTQSTKAQYDALFSEMGILFGPSGFTTDTSSYSTNSVNNVYDYSGAITIGGIEIKGDPSRMTLTDLVDEIGIYVQR